MGRVLGGGLLCGVWCGGEVSRVRCGSVFPLADSGHSWRSRHLLGKPTLYPKGLTFWQNCLVFGRPRKSKHNLSMICLPNVGKCVLDHLNGTFAFMYLSI